MAKPPQVLSNVKTAFTWTENVFRTLLGNDMDKIVLGGGTVLAMHWSHRVSTDNAESGKELVRPKYEELARKLWEYSETALRTGTLPKELFATEEKQKHRNDEQWLLPAGRPAPDA